MQRGCAPLRIDSTPSLSATNAFVYNQRAEVTNAEMSTATYAYSYDDIGNRRWATSDAVASTYAANQLNQYSAVTNAGENCPVTYDLEGNMTRNGAWCYFWDGENNMTVAVPVSTTNGSLRVDNGYDHLKRRILKTVDVKTGYEPPGGNPPTPGVPGQWVPVKTTRFVWDGWNIAAEITVDEQAGTTNVTRYLWGLDLSGSVQGAGGVGGLLAVIEGDGSVYLPAYEANGNITEYVDQSGDTVSKYEYDAFGNSTAQSGDLAGSFKFRFSTKNFDAENWNLVYQQRQYIPPLGRWANRDSFGERGGLNLYRVGVNNLVNKHDYLGLAIPVIIYPTITSPMEQLLFDIKGNPIYVNTPYGGDQMAVTTTGEAVGKCKSKCHISIVRIDYRPHTYYYPDESGDGYIVHEEMHVFINSAVLKWGAKPQPSSRSCKYMRGMTDDECTSKARIAGRKVLDFMLTSISINEFFDRPEISFGVLDPMEIRRTFGVSVLTKLNALRASKPEEWACPE